MSDILIFNILSNIAWIKRIECLVVNNNEDYCLEPYILKIKILYDDYQEHIKHGNHIANYNMDNIVFNNYTDNIHYLMDQIKIIVENILPYISEIKFTNGIIKLYNGKLHSISDAAMFIDNRKDYYINDIHMFYNEWIIISRKEKLKHLLKL